METVLQNQCWTRNNANFVKHRRNPVIDNASRSINFSTEFCPHGDLVTLYKTYKGTGPNSHIPEPALWMIFQKLLEQCIVLEKGTSTLR